MINLTDEMHKAGWTHTWLGERCPNRWKCLIGCHCHRLAPGALIDDLKEHYKIEAWTINVPAHADLPEWAKRG
jgi:hypothetical protein